MSFNHTHNGEPCYTQHCALPKDNPPYVHTLPPYNEDVPHLTVEELFPPTHDDNRHSKLYYMAQQAVRDSKEWFPGNDAEIHSVPNMALCLAGEVGEVANLVKKVVRGTYTLEEVQAQIEDELADVFTYLLCIWGILGTDGEKEYYVKRDRNARRFTDPEAPHRRRSS